MIPHTVSTKATRRMLPVALVLAGSLLSMPTMQAQGTTAGPAVAAPGTAAATSTGAGALAQNAVTKYDNRWDLYGGLNFMNGQAGQNLPKRYDMGGGEFMATYWLGNHFGIKSNHLGIAADYRIGAGTTPDFIQAQAFGLNRILVYQNILSGGVQYRGPKNRYVAINFHALAGATHGTFDTAITGYPQGQAQEPTIATAGVYSNRTSPWGAAGGSIDFNYSPKVTFRLSPDMTFEHFGTETREFFAISMGLNYRLGHLKK